MRAKWIKQFVLCAGIIFIMMLGLVGCKQSHSTDPKDYCPLGIGSVWTYEITLGNTEPLYCYSTNWPVGEGVMSVRTRGRFSATTSKGFEGKRFKLELLIVGKTPELDYFKNPNAMEVKVVKDELGVFENCEKIFWLPGDDPFSVLQICCYPPDTPGNPTSAWSYSGGYGTSWTPIFLGPDLSSNLKDTPEANIRFVEFDGSTMHLQREVKADELNGEHHEADDILNKPFIEDRWYQEDVGLTKFEQRIDGKVSMTWELVDHHINK